MQHILTREQYDAVETFKSRHHMRVVAYAGAGKTSTLRAMAGSVLNRRGLYIAFNKSVQEEAQGRMPSNVESRTGDSLGWTGIPKNITSSTNVTPRAGSMIGIFVASASATPTIAVYGSATTTTGTIIVNVFTPVAGTFYPLPFSFSNGCYVVISGTVDCTVGVSAG